MNVSGFFDISNSKSKNFRKIFNFSLRVDSKFKRNRNFSQVTDMKLKANDGKSCAISSSKISAQLY